MFDATGAAAEAVVIKPDLAMWDEAHALGLECVVRVSESEDLERALRYFDPEVFLLAVGEDADDDPLAVVLELLQDVPAGSSRSRSSATRPPTTSPSSSVPAWTRSSSPTMASPHSRRTIPPTSEARQRQ